MKTTTIGQTVESAVAQHLKQKSYTLLDHNWRTKWCEIDLIMQKNQVLYFIEVKFRKSPDQGSGIEYITPKKLEQMQRAALSWVTINKFDGNYRLVTAEVNGLKSTIRIIEI